MGWFRVIPQPVPRDDFAVANSVSLSIIKNFSKRSSRLWMQIAERRRHFRGTVYITEHI
jgi:hypothetical protein